MSVRAGVVSSFTKYVFERSHVSDAWKILVLDTRATQILSSVFLMHELVKFRIFATESLYLSRQPFNMEAIYIMCPERAEVDMLIRDFTVGSPKYTCAHVYFLYECSSEIMSMIASTNARTYVKTLSQLDVDFVPIESCVYSLESPDTAHIYALPLQSDREKEMRISKLAQQLVTVCVTLQECPRICYRKNENNHCLAQLTRIKLDACRESDPTLGQGAHKDQSLLLILDRGFDVISPLLHELTLQAMCYDVLPVENHMYCYDENRKFKVTDEDPFWRELRHVHIADASNIIQERIRDFANNNKQFAALRKLKMGSTNEGFESDGSRTESDGKDALELRELSRLIKQMPRYQTEAARYAAITNIFTTCMSLCQAKLTELCKIEQDFAMGQTSDRQTLCQPMRLLAEFLKKEMTSTDDRLRLLMIFVVIKGGISENHLEKLLSLAKVDTINKALFAGLSVLVGAQLVLGDPVSMHMSGYTDPNNSGQPQLSQSKQMQALPPISAVSKDVLAFLPIKGNRKNRDDANCYVVSRWTTYLRDLIEEAIAGTLNKSQYTFLAGTTTPASKAPTPMVDLSPKDFIGPSARLKPGGTLPNLEAHHSYGTYSRNSSIRGSSGTKLEHCGPRLIVCVVGGVTWSEIRTAYEVTQKCIETRIAESDRHTVLRSGPTLAPATLPGGGGAGWNWEVVIGGTHIITPESFIGDLDTISRRLIETLPDAQSGTTNQTPHRTSGENFHLF